VKARRKLAKSATIAPISEAQSVVGEMHRMAHEFAERAAEELYRMGGLDPGRTPGALRLAVALGLRIILRPDPSDRLPTGALFFEDHEIRVRRELDREQRELTIGHELGHYWLRIRGQQRARSPGEVTWEEALCDEIGRSIVAPRVAVRTCVAVWGQDYERSSKALWAPAWLVRDHARLDAHREIEVTR
jgi:hypothetical protein